MSVVTHIPTPAEPTEIPAPGLELADPRVIEMSFGKRPYRWTFRRILREDWEQFFKSFETETQQILGEHIETFEIETGLVELARRCVTAVDGYVMPESGDFRTMLPYGHLKSFGLALRDVRATPIPEDHVFALSQLHEVSLDCTWSAAADGKMSVWSGLIHRFNPPTLPQQRAFNRACATYRVTGDDRGGRTIYPARQRYMMDLYDELIDSVDDAYRVHGKPLVGREAIAREMDCCHKVAAILGFLDAGGTGRIEKPRQEERGA